MSRFLVALFLLFICCMPVRASETPLATGNGFGFAVYSCASHSLTGYYAHPYKFMKADPKNPLAEGIETTNFIKNLSWSASASPLTAENYVAESQIIRSDDAASTQYFYMPFGLEANVLVTAVETAKPTENALRIKWQHPVKSETIEKIDGVDTHILQFEGVQETLALIPLAQNGSSDKGSSFECFRGASAWALTCADNSEELKMTLSQVKKWQDKLNPRGLQIRELDQIEKWRVKPQIHFTSEKEHQLWRQSEIVLRMSQIRESNTATRHNHGLILASLPDGAWFVPWVRDMAYATMALTHMGHQEEARSAIEAYFNAQPSSKMQKEVGNQPYQISVCRYFGDGSEEPFFTMEGSNNVELDDWGLALWVLADYFEHYHDKSILTFNTYRGPLYESAREFVVKPLLANLEPYKDGLIVTADTSIWEERQKDKKHFAFSTIAALNGLKGFSKITSSPVSDNLEARIALLEKGFNGAYVSGGTLRGAVESGIKNEVDGAMLTAITSGLIKDRAVIDRALADMQRLKMPSGGYRRVTCILTDPAIYEYWYERQEFVFIDFLMAQIYRDLKMTDKADAIIAPIVEKASQDHNFIPEMYVSEVNYRFTGPVGAPTGAIPMVGYGAGIFVLYELEKASGG